MRSISGQKIIDIYVRCDGAAEMISCIICDFADFKLGIKRLQESTEMERYYVSKSKFRLFLSSKYGGLRAVRTVIYRSERLLMYLLRGGPSLVLYVKSQRSAPRRRFWINMGVWPVRLHLQTIPPQVNILPSDNHPNQESWTTKHRRNSWITKYRRNT